MGNIGNAVRARLIYSGGRAASVSRHTKGVPRCYAARISVTSCASFELPSAVRKPSRMHKSRFTLRVERLYVACPGRFELPTF